MKQWIIALTTAGVYLAASLATNGWCWTWALWVAYAFYRFNEAKHHR